MLRSPSFRRPERIIVLLIVLVLGQPGSAIGRQPVNDRSSIPVLPDTLVLDLGMSIAFALEHSWSMEQERMNLRRDRLNLEASRAALKSNADLSFVLPDFDQSIKELIDTETGEPKVLSTRGARYSTTLSIRQPIPTNGTISLNGVLNRTQDGLIAYSPDTKTYYGRVFLRLDQPILQPNRIRNDIRRAELRLESTEISFHDQELSIVNSVTREFYDLLEQVWEDSLAANDVARMEQVFAVGQELYEADELSESDILQMEVQLSSARNRASSAQGGLVREIADFKRTIGLPLDQILSIDHLPVFDLTTPVAQEEIEKALQQRTDIRRNAIRREQEVMDMDEQRSSGRMTGNITLTMGLEGRGDQMDRFYDAITDPDQSRGAAIGFTLPLWDWGRVRARVEAQQVDLDKLDRSREELILDIRREVESVIDRIREAEQRLELMTRSVEAARRSFDLSRENFEQGEIGVQEILLIQSRLSEAEEDHLEAYIDYRQALVDIDAVTTGSGRHRGGW